ncbi:hypothetical protein GQ53DRAFT_610598, partial [Thozetella sp. PMI_491]
GFGGDSTIPQSCAAALNSTIDCDDDLQVLALTNVYASPNATGNAASLCSTGCSSALTNYQNSVKSACGNSAVIDPQLANTFVGDLLHDYYDLVCTKDSTTGQYCPDYLVAAFQAINPPVTEWDHLPTSVMCSACQVSYFEILQKSPFLGYNLDTALNWFTTQKVITNITCLSGNTYTIQAGDTCESIAVAKSVSQGTLWAINNLRPDCAALTVGQSLCLPQQCSLYTLQANDTCWSIAADQGLSFSTLLGYNPTINADCTNLNITSSVICISNPQRDYVPPASNLTNPNAPLQFATATVAPPGPTPFQTTPNCGGFYQVQVADTCQRISLAAGISVALFEEINPAIDENCFNLIPDFWYCVLPTQNWNTTNPGGGNSSSTSSASSTTEAPPAPTPPGTTHSCYQWHVVVSGDSCFAIEQSYGITMDQLVQWNPNLNQDCGNLLLGEAYCVNGGSSSGPTSSTTQAPPAPTPPGTTTSCYEWHVVVSGDTCFDIEQSAGITMAQLTQWNPDLHDDCGNLLLGEAYCI